MTTAAPIPAARSNRAHARALLALGLPLVGSNLAQFAVTMTDTVMMGWYGVVDLAALTIAGSLYFVFFLVGTGAAWAVLPMVASAVGGGEVAQVRRVTRMGLWITILYSVALLPILFFSERLFLLAGQDPDVAERAGLYLLIAGCGLGPHLFIMVLKSYFSALERTRVILVVTIASAILNAALNYVLIFGNFGAPEMGVAGAAIASVSIGVFGCVWLAIYAVRVTPEYELFKNPQRPDWEAFARVFRLGWPISLTNLAEVGLFSASSIMMGWIGVHELAAHGIALQIASATFMVHIGLSQAVTVRTGQAWGKGDPATLRDGARIGLLISMCVAAMTVVMFLTVPELLIGLFLSPMEPARDEIVRIGIVLLALAALFQVVDALQVMSLGMLRGIQDTRIPMILAAFSYWIVGLPASYVLGFALDLGAAGIWYGLVIGLALAGALLSRRFWTRAPRPALLA